MRAWQPVALRTLRVAEGDAVTMPIPSPRTPPQRPVTSAVIPLPPPGLYLRVCAALALVVPWRTRYGWQWYRRAIGGRWSRSLSGAGWRRVEQCPGPLTSDILGGESVPLGVCFDERVVSLEDLDGNPSRSDAHECHCEVWS